MLMFKSTHDRIVKNIEFERDNVNAMRKFWMESAFKKQAQIRLLDSMIKNQAAQLKKPRDAKRRFISKD